MKTLLVPTVLVLLVAVLAGCSKKPDATPADASKQATGGGTVNQVVEGMTGKSDIEAGQRAKATIRKISAQENKDLNEAMEKDK